MKRPKDTTRNMGALATAREISPLFATLAAAQAAARIPSKPKQVSAAQTLAVNACDSWQAGTLSYN